MEKISITMNKPIYLRQAILDLSKMSVKSITTTHSPGMARIFGCVTWILTPSFTTLRLMISAKILTMMLRLDSTQVATAAAVFFP